MVVEKLNRNLAKRSKCPIATTLDVVGDKWTLLLVRDIGLFDKHRNKDFQDAAEKIPSNILAHRLKLLVKDGLVQKRLYQKHPPRYEYHLTEAGKGLLPVIKAMAKWADRFVDEVAIPEKIKS